MHKSFMSNNNATRYCKVLERRILCRLRKKNLVGDNDALHALPDKQDIALSPVYFSALPWHSARAHPCKIYFRADALELL